MDPYDAWTFRRLFRRCEVGDRIAGMSDRYRPLAELLIGLEGHSRYEAWSAFLEALPDSRSVIDAVARAEPEGPAPERKPEAERDAAGDWGPIEAGRLPAAEPFPADVLPAPARALAESAARSIACPVDYPAVGALAGASGMIGRSVLLRVKPGYCQSASLYAVLVGGASGGKSPALGLALAPLWDAARSLRELWRAERRDWRAAKADSRRAAIVVKYVDTDGLSTGAMAPTLVDDARDEEPRLERIVSTDPTAAALVPILADTPRGLFVAPDEMTGWVRSMAPSGRGKGGDRPFYLSAWNGEPIYLDRKARTGGPIVVPCPFVSLAGGITPDMLSALSERRGRDDGFLARILFCYPDPVPRVYCEEGMPGGVAAEWSILMHRLRRHPMHEGDGHAVGREIDFEAGAAREWAEWCHAHYAEAAGEDFPESLVGAWGKFEAYAARLALILHLMELASDFERPDDDVPAVPVRIVGLMARLMAYFKSHARRVHAALHGRIDGGDDVRALVRWIVRDEKGTFSERDVRRQFGRFAGRPELLASALRWMVGRNLIREEVDPGPGRRPGRRPGARYEVNPAIGELPRV